MPKFAGRLNFVILHTVNALLHFIEALIGYSSIRSPPRSEGEGDKKPLPHYNDAAVVKFMC